MLRPGVLSSLVPCTGTNCSRLSLPGYGPHLEVWSVERFLAALLFIFAFGVLGVFTADTFLCPEGTGVRFWDGCLYEVIGFGVGGGVFGLVAFVYLLRLLSLTPRQPNRP